MSELADLSYDELGKEMRKVRESIESGLNPLAALLRFFAINDEFDRRRNEWDAHAHDKEWRKRWLQSGGRSESAVH